MGYAHTFSEIILCIRKVRRNGKDCIRIIFRRSRQHHSKKRQTFLIIMNNSILSNANNRAERNFRRH